MSDFYNTLRSLIHNSEHINIHNYRIVVMIVYQTCIQKVGLIFSKSFSYNKLHL